MEKCLVTGATSFLGYHVTRALNRDGIRPRVIERGPDPGALDRLDVERCAGSLEDAAALGPACAGVETVLHLAYKVSMGGGAAQADMQRVNVDGTRHLLDVASRAGVRRVVVVGSALAIGVNRQPVPLDETAGPEHEFGLPYARIRREAEQMALSLARPDFAVTSVCPSFTFGPDDPVGAPANKLLKALISRRLPVTLPVGFGCLDVRDFANGMILAARRGRSGERYLLSGDNVTTKDLLQQAAAIAGVKPPRFTPPTFLLRTAVGAIELFSGLRGAPAPVTRDVLDIIGRYAWYDTSKARQELGWTSRPLGETLADTIAWLRQPRADPPVARA